MKKTIKWRNETKPWAVRPRAQLPPRVVLRLESGHRAVQTAAGCRRRWAALRPTNCGGMSGASSQHRDRVAHIIRRLARAARPPRLCPLTLRFLPDHHDISHGASLLLRFARLQVKCEGCMASANCHSLRMIGMDKEQRPVRQQPLLSGHLFPRDPSPCISRCCTPPGEPTDTLNQPSAATPTAAGALLPLRAVSREVERATQQPAPHEAARGVHENHGRHA